MKIEVINTKYTTWVPNGSIMTVVLDFGDGDVMATLDGGDGFEWFMSNGTYRVVQDQPIQDTITIKPGKYYRTRDGRKVGPMERWTSDAEHPFECIEADGDLSSEIWKEDGTSCDRDGKTIIAEWTEGDDMNAICDDRQDGPFVRDPELTSPYGDGNHPLPPMAGTLAELNVKPGDVVECVEYGGDYWTPGLKYTISKSGEIPSNDGDLFHLDAPCEFKGRIISRASDTPKTWGEMTDAEKGAVALAFVQGGTVQCWQDGDTPEYWADIPDPNWNDDCKFRIKPEPTRETVTLDGFIHNNEWFFRERDARATHRITFDTIDGKPVLDSIKMEELG